MGKNVVQPRRTVHKEDVLPRIVPLEEGRD
jgi:hypothetical protein